MKKLVAAVFVSVSLYASSAFAVLSADQLAVTDAIDLLISDLSTWGWTAILAVVTFTIGAKLFKRFLGAST